MALIEIVCPRCKHRGYVSANSLPCELRCHVCNRARMVREGESIVRSSATDDDLYAEYYEKKPKQRRKRGAA